MGARLGIRHLQIGGAVALIAVAVGIASAATTAQPASLTGRAATLATNVVGAHTATQRDRALLAIARALNLPVATSKGAVVLPGGHDLPRGFVLYDFELRAVAGAVGRGETLTLTDLASRLTTIDVHPRPGKPVSPARLRTVLLKTVRAAMRSPQSQSSLGPLIVRELGRRHRRPYDLAAHPSAARIQIDPVQALVILSAVTAAGASPHSHSASANALSSASLCDGFDTWKEASGVGKYGIGVIGGLVSKGAKGVAITLDAIHGPLLAFSVAVTRVTPDTQRTHYGPSGHATDARKELTFGVHVEMLDDYPDVVIQCGALIGMKFPHKGPIPGVRVQWGTGGVGQFTVSLQDMAKHGTITYEPEDKKTGPDGNAFLRFVPKDEKVPGFGQLKEDVTILQGLAAYQSAFGNVPGTIAQYLIPKDALFGVGISRHAPRGFQFSTPDYTFTQTTPSGTATITIQVQGHVCGEDPWAAPWDITESVTGTTPAGPITNIATYQLAIPPTAPGARTGTDFIHDWLLPQPVDPSAFQLTLRITPVAGSLNGTMTPSTIQQQAQITEDTGCPEPA